MGVIVRGDAHNFFREDVTITPKGDKELVLAHLRCAAEVAQTLIIDGLHKNALDEKFTDLQNYVTQYTSSNETRTRT